jgi:glutamyl-tRNA synthetase
MGELKTGPEVIDDFILIKSDGFPTYNFAHIIDDHEMQISHVIRGQEFLASIPNYLNLYEALGFEPPIMATMPHILGPDGKKKLSKRDGAKDVLDYIKEGYLPEALVNFIASLGWNDGSEQEIFSRDELVAKFSLERVQRSGARFDENRLLWMNGSWIRALDLNSLYERTKDFWPKSAGKYTDEYRRQVLKLTQERLKFFAELPSLTNFFFEDLPLDMQLIDGNKQLKKFEHSELKSLLETAKAEIEGSDFSSQDLSERLNGLLETTGQKPGVLFSLVRIATTQAPFSPSLADTMAVLGRETVLRRIDTTLAAL